MDLVNNGEQLASGLRQQAQIAQLERMWHYSCIPGMPGKLPCCTLYSNAALVPQGPTWA
jgi:hypothetical protein